MKKVSIKRKKWLDRRSKKIAINYNKHFIKSKTKVKNSKFTTYYNNTIKKYEFFTPQNFSFINNPNETILFFNKIFDFILKKTRKSRDIFINTNRTDKLTIDAIMFLIAIINNINFNIKQNLNFSGNEPLCKEAKNEFKESGFYKYVKRIIDAPIDRNENNIQIVSGRVCDVKLAQRISDFIQNKTNVQLSKLRFIYVMMIELMSNTHKHAYNNSDNVLNSRWFCFVKFIKDGKFSFSFLDTGLGIPTTIRKNFLERINILGLKTDNDYLCSVLNGDFRTSTNKEYRGKGIPKIREFSKSNKIQKLHIISNNADILVISNEYKREDILNKLKGTLYYWEIDINNI